MNSKFSKKVIFCLFISICLIIVLISGCKKNSQVASTQNNNEKIIVKDGLGRNIEISKKVDRVLTNYTIPAHMLLALGAQDKLIGADNGSINNPLFKKVKPNISNSTDFKNKNSFSIEAGLALNPDLVLITAKNKKLIDDIESHGMKVFAIQAENIEELKNTMLNLGKALGKDKEASEFLSYYDITIDNIKNTTSKIKDSDKPKVYIAGSDLFSTCGKDMYQHSIIEFTGGKNVGSELSGGWVKVSPEQIIKWNPDIILLTQYSGVKVEDILKNNALQGINAVKNKNVFLFPSKVCAWDFPSPQAVLGIEWLAVKTHPSLFKNLDMEKEADKFFKKFYNINFNELGEGNVK